MKSIVAITIAVHVSTHRHHLLHLRAGLAEEEARLLESPPFFSMLLYYALMLFSFG